MSDVLEAGDVLRFSRVVIEAIAATADGSVLMRVQKIQRQEDHTVKLWLETAAVPNGERRQ